MSGILNRGKIAKAASRSVKYSDAEEEPFKRFILMHLQQCEEAVSQDLNGETGKAVYGATEYILRELPDRKPGSLKTKFNKILKKEERTAKAVERKPKGALSSESKRPKGSYARKSLVPLPDRDFVKNPMLLQLKSYQSVYGDVNLNLFLETRPIESRDSQDSKLGKRNMEKDVSFASDPTLVSVKKSQNSFQKRLQPDSTLSTTYISHSDLVEDEKTNFPRNDPTEKSDFLMFNPEGSSGQLNLIDASIYREIHTAESRERAFNDSLFILDLDQRSETSLDAFNLFAVDSIFQF